MPYIKSKERIRLDTALDKVHLNVPGELNYAINKLCIEYLQDREMSYITLNDIIGAIELAKLEFMRRIVEKYEDHKIKENGDIFQAIIRNKNI